MAQIWKPSGNNSQTAVDMQIERLLFHLRTLNDSLQNLHNGLSQIEQELIDISKQVSFVKMNAKIVSLKEFAKMKKLLVSLSDGKVAYIKHINDTRKGIEQTDSEIEKLHIKRKSLETKILEFRRK